MCKPPFIIACGHTSAAGHGELFSLDPLQMLFSYTDRGTEMTYILDKVQHTRHIPDAVPKEHTGAEHAEHAIEHCKVIREADGVGL